MNGLFNVAGGVRYHARGWRYADGLWQPFREALGGWLHQWQPGGKKLVIIGPSAGYCLKLEWLARFSEIACLDPDPLARLIFGHRMGKVAPGTRLSWSTDNFLAERVPALQIRRFDRFLAEHPGAPVLFSGFLGQFSLLLHENRVNVPKSLNAWKSNLVRRSLAGHPWASFHDRLSGKLPTRFEQPFMSPVRMTDDELIEKLYAEPSGTMELADHDTERFFPSDREHAYFSWRLTPRWTHLIEGTCSAGKDKTPQTPSAPPTSGA